MNEAQVSVGHHGQGVDNLWGTEAQGVLPLSVKGHSHESGQESARGRMARKGATHSQDGQDSSLWPLPSKPAWKLERPFHLHLCPVE